LSGTVTEQIHLHPVSDHAIVSDRHRKLGEVAFSWGRGADRTAVHRAKRSGEIVFGCQHLTRHMLQKKVWAEGRKKRRGVGKGRSCCSVETSRQVSLKVWRGQTQSLRRERQRVAISCRSEKSCRAGQVDSAVGRAEHRVESRCGGS